MLGTMTRGQCKDCQCLLQGKANYCVTCYKKRIKPCPECILVKRNARGREVKNLVLKYRAHEGRGKKERCHQCKQDNHKDRIQLVCFTCHNQRFIFMET